MKIRLQRVHYMPKELKPGILYVSEEFGAAAHLCPCGCGSKIRTPLGPTEWALEETDNGPTIYPSIGNWQLPCQSHYWISDGRVVWSTKWTLNEIAAGRRSEDQRRRDYNESLDRTRVKVLHNFWHWLKGLFGR